MPQGVEDFNSYSRQFKIFSTWQNQYRKYFTLNLELQGLDLTKIYRLSMFINPNYLKLNHEFARAKTSEYLIKEMDVWNGK